ncbi:MAG: M36 family metallopeptidase [Pyrinomonadaceae bacterium]|nr:M36 family metallopeptidase [Pyrinomonadaceae bacterium]
MSRKMNQKSRRARVSILAALLVSAFVIVGIYSPARKAQAGSATTTAASSAELYRRLVPNYDLNASRAVANTRRATSQQQAALNNLKAATNAPQMTARWNDFGGSPDVLYNFASQPYAGTPEEVGRAFLQENTALFGIANVADLRLVSNKQALGGSLLRFQQTFGGIDVKNGGVGLVIKDNRVIAASGPYFNGINVSTQPAISAAQARQTVDANLAQYRISLPANIQKLMEPALNLMTQQLAPVSNLEPRLGIYPTADGYRLVWKVAKFSTNPFGLFLIEVDAQTGEIVSRKDFINFQQSPVHPLTADIYPKYPDITPELKDQSIISDCNGTPCGQERVNLRSFDLSNVTTGLNGTLTGKHVVVNNVLATKQPFAQAALGTWHFRQDNPTGFEARTNEQDQFAEPAEHQDEINAFFFVTYLLEYVDYLHVAGDRQTVGNSEGDFPNNYPGNTTPLTATVHFPNQYLVLNVVLRNQVPDPTDPNLVFKALGMDNAFAADATGIYQLATGMPAPDGVANPTAYGHGFLMNDLALEGTVPYHEGMHAVTTPIAGLEGGVEASAMNEGQADMWAFTITNNPSLGEYVIQAKGLRDRSRSRGQDPDSLLYVRTAKSTLKYSDIGTLFWPAEPELIPIVLPAKPARYDFEEHYDGEIFMSTMWDVREMFNRVYPNDSTYKRPLPKDGSPSKKITKGTEIFERDFLGAMYILGTMAPDTFVKARDAMLISDQMLYPTDSADPTSVGKHRALIEQVFAAHELGVNAKEVDGGGKATISTQVSSFAGDQAAPAVPSNVQVAAASPRSLRVSWNGVPGAIAYEVLKRKIGFENRRQPNGARDYADGDESTTGFRHVGFVGANTLSYVDAGPIHEIFAASGLNDLFDSEYVVRAIGVNPTGQVGWSNLSGSSRAVKTTQDLTTQVDATISNITFSNGVMSFDNKLTNARGAFSTDKTAYGPIQFQIVSISNPTVTVKNADQGGNSFIYNQTLPLGATSNAKRLEFNDPAAQLFTFDAKVLAGAFTSTTLGEGSQGYDGTANPPQPVTYSVYREERTGNLVAGEPSSFVTGDPSPTYGDPNFKGITWDQVEVITKPDAQLIDVTLSSTLARDLDLQLVSESGQVLAQSTTETASEHFTLAIQPNTRYFIRVLGWANGPADYKIVSDQLLPQGSPNENAGTRTVGGSTAYGGSGGTTTAALPKLVRFTVNPLTKQVTAKILQ